MANHKLINAMAEAAYEGICGRAMKMVNEAFPSLDGIQRALVEAAVAAGVTATIATFKEAGLLNHEPK